MAAAEAGRRGQSDFTLHFAAAQRNRCLGILHLRQDALGIGQKAVAFMGQGQLAGGAHEQFDPQPRLEPAQTPADHGRGHAGSTGRGGKTAALGNLNKGFELGKTVHTTPCNACFSQFGPSKRSAYSGLIGCRASYAAADLSL